MSTQPQPELVRRKRKVLKTVEDLDVFPKVPETCLETTSYGGSASILAVVIICWLVILETKYFLDPDYKFSFSPDTEIDTKLRINVDMTVGMPCGIIGADIVDSTNQNVMKFGELTEEFAHFELTERQKAYFNSKSSMNSYLREEYHSLSTLLWKNEFINLYDDMPQMTKQEKSERGLARACRLHGQLELNKVAGNFHITAGKTLPLLRGHAHIAAFMSERDYNFSHRIYKFSFGDSSSAIIHPLEGDEKVAQKNQMLYQYFIQIVPTKVNTRFRSYQTYQYSVREMEREVDHDKGSHGVAGIFFKYDMSGLQVSVTEDSQPFLIYLVRLCAIIGGVYATIGMLYNHLSYFSCQYKLFMGSKDKDIHLNTSYVRHGEAKSEKFHGGASKFQRPVVDLLHQQQAQPLQSAFLNEPETSKESLPDILASHAL